MAVGDIKVVQENSGGTYDEIVLEDSGVNVGTLMTNPMTASGDIIYGGTSGAPTRLAKGNDGEYLKLASGVPSWAAGGGGLANVVEDTTPQLGGSLDVNGNKIVSVSNGDIDIEPNGTGDVLLGNFKFDADQTVGSGQDNYVLTYDNSSGKISLEASAGGSGAVEAKDTGYTIQTTDSTKTFTCNSASAQTFNLPSVAAVNVGIEFTIIKLGAGQVTIDAADSDLIEDSGAGDTIYCADEGITTITLKLVTETQWIIKFCSGTWITTD